MNMIAKFIKKAFKWYCKTTAKLYENVPDKGITHLF